MISPLYFIKNISYNILNAYKRLSNNDKNFDRSKVLLATVSNDNFAIGTAVMLYSMKKHIPNFSDYPIVVFSDNCISPLSEKAKILFRSISPNIEIKEINNEVYRNARCKPEHHRLAYLTLEVFNQTDYNKVIFFDGDMICTGDLSEAFSTDQAIFGCKVGKRSSKTGLSWTASINTGFFGVSHEMLSNETYKRILEVVKNRKDKYLGLLDQKTINMFRKHNGFPVFLIDYNYNYRDWDDEETLINNMPKIKSIHYSGYAKRAKPWEFSRVKELGVENHLAYRIWRDEADMLCKDHPLAKEILPEDPNFQK